MPFSEEKVRRLLVAIAANLDNWSLAAEEIAEHAHPITGNKARALHLQKSLLQAKLSIHTLLTDAQKD